ncbi:MAG: protein kinase [Eubacteriales bacterium]|nr:protein kinase [Eubacteriales bacterium]
MLLIGDTVQGLLGSRHYRIIDRLGEGGQGAVFLADDERGEVAVKWYHRQNAVEQQREMIARLIRMGPPGGEAGRRFVWPLDVVTKKGDLSFGYVMPAVNLKSYAELGQVWARLRPTPGMRQRCRISWQLAQAYRQLHLAGYCYRDISMGNFLFDPKSGEVLIIDNDNIGINQQSGSRILGTMEFMAPEVITGRQVPSTSTDLYSLAVLLFYFWIWHHPMHGMLEYNVRVWDIPAKKRIYGEMPVFIFDPRDGSNRLPADPEYQTPLRFWDACPKSIRDLFIRSFTDGIRNPDRRVTEGEWVHAFRQLENQIARCPHDRAENFWQPGMKQLQCWHCHRRFDAPPRFVISSSSGLKHVLVLPETKLRRSELEPFCSEESMDEVVAEVIQNPNNPNVWGLRNLTGESWQFMPADGSEPREVVSGRAVPISAGHEVKIGYQTNLRIEV